MSDQSRLFLAAVLMLGVLVLSWYFTGNNTAVSTRSSDEQSSSFLSGEASSDSVVTPDSLLSTESFPSDSTAVSTVPDEYNEKIITVVIPSYDFSDTLVVAQISTTGGSVVSWKLCGYRAFPDQSGELLVDLASVPVFSTTDSSGTPLLFSYTGPDTLVADSTGVTIELFDGQHTKTFVFTRGRFDFVCQSSGIDSPFTVDAGSIPVTENLQNTRGYFSASWYTNSYKSKNSTKIEGLEPLGNVSWIATRNKYFGIVLFPLSSPRADAFIAQGGEVSPEITVYDSKVRVYAGPLSYVLLEDLGSSTSKMVDFGWPVIRWIGKIIFYFLTVALSFVGNWGVRIIVLAFVLKILLSPLTTKSYVSMQKMQKIQPLMQDLQKKYANDPKQQQVELQKLYKREGVNPLGGCLPVLLQMPVFFAMYRVLANMVELRGAPFVLWINDLSRPEILIHFQDKFLGLEGIGIMALLLGLIMFLQTKLTGSSSTGAAAQQQKMMLYMMPLFMTFLFMRFASGLTLYWLVFNILTLLHQELIKKKLGMEQASGKNG